MIPPVRHPGQGARRQRDPGTTVPHIPSPPVARSGDRACSRPILLALTLLLSLTACGVKGNLKLPEEVEKAKTQPQTQSTTTDDREQRLENMMREQRYPIPPQQRR